MITWYLKLGAFLSLGILIDFNPLIGSLGNEAVIVTKDDDVYALGFNGSGCLGVGDQNSTMEPRKIEPLCQKKVKGKNV